MKVAKLCEDHFNDPFYNKYPEKIIAKLRYQCFKCQAVSFQKKIENFTPSEKKAFYAKKRLKQKERDRLLNNSVNHELIVDISPAEEINKTKDELEKELQAVRKLKMRLEKENRLIDFEKKERKLKTAREYQKKQVVDLSDSYVKQCFVQGYGGKSSLGAKDIPQEVVDVYRDLMQFKRILKKQKESYVWQVI